MIRLVRVVQLVKSLLIRGTWDLPAKLLSGIHAVCVLVQALTILYV